MNFPQNNWWQKLKIKAQALKLKWQERRRRQRLQTLKRRTEYLFTNPRLFWHKVRLRLHPQSLWSYFTSKSGLWRLCKLSIALLVGGLGVITGGYVYYRYNLDINLGESTDCLEYSTIEFYDATGQELLWRNTEGDICYPISLHQVSPYFIEGLITIEDHDFYAHPGFKFTSIARATFNNLRGKPLQGGSTITQQYVKNAILRDSQRNLDRKIREAILVPEIEHLYTKNQILAAYINTAFFGFNYSGIEAAAQGYFGKPSIQLTLDEAALLVGTLQGPNIVWQHPELHLKRRDIVLREMLAAEKISQKQHDQAVATDTLAKVKLEATQPLGATMTAPHFSLAAKQAFNKIMCRDIDNCAQSTSGSYQVITTLDLATYEASLAALAAGQEQLTPNSYDNHALIIVDNDNQQVKSLIGSIDFQQAKFGQVNSLGKSMSPGNLWAPFIYASLLENNQDKQFGNLSSPLRYDQLKRHSQALQLTGINNFQVLSEKLSLPTSQTTSDCSQQCFETEAAGQALEVRFDELVNAYSALAADGQYRSLNYIAEIRNSQQVTLYSHQVSSVKVMSSKNSQQLNNILRGHSRKPANLKSHRRLVFLRDQVTAGKTNYAVAYDDRWTIGLYLGREAKLADEALADEVVATFQSLVLEKLLAKLSN